MQHSDPLKEAVSASIRWQSASRGEGASERVDEIYAADVFDLRKMKERLPKTTMKAVTEVIAGRRKLTVENADVIATAMKDWAIERGVTHYTHWFQPLTGLTAEKHDGLTIPDGAGGAANAAGRRSLWPLD